MFPLNFLNKRILFTLTILLSTLILAGCSILPTAKKNEQVTLKFWGLWESPTTINQIISEYKKVKPNVNIVYEKRSLQNYRESLESQIQSGRGPDVFAFHNTWTLMLKEELSPVPASVVSEKDFAKIYYPTARADLRTPDKKLSGIPLEIDGLGLFWNEDIFTAAGITEPPKTWPEVAQTAARLTVRDTAGNIRTAGVALGTAGNVDHFSDILGMMIMQNGGEPKNPNDKPSADALEYYSNFAKGQNRVWDETLPSSTVAFAGGNLAMYFAPSWKAIEIKNTNPLLKFKVAPVPQLEGNRVGWASYWSAGVSAKSPAQQEAWEFVKYLSQDESLIRMFSEASKSPGRFFGEPYPKVELGSKLASDPIVGAYITDAPFMRSFSMASATQDNGLNDQIIKAYEDAVNSVAAGTPASTALETTAKNVTNIISRFSSSQKP